MSRVIEENSKDYKACADKKYIKKILTDGSSLKFIVACYNSFLNSFSCKPDDAKFPKYRANGIIDEDLSVKWNREEIARRNEAREAEVKRLNTERNELNTLYETGIKKLLAEENNFSLKEAELIYAYAYTESHSYGVQEVINTFSEIAELYNNLKNL